MATEDLLAAGQTFEAMGETYVLASVDGVLADALVGQGSDEEAGRFSRRTEELAD